MGTIGKIIILGIVIFFAVLAYACILVAATADEDAARMYREYEAWKRKHANKEEHKHDKVEF